MLRSHPENDWQEQLATILEEAGEKKPDRVLNRWRLFFLAVRETFAYAGGEEWLVAHHRLRRGRGHR